MSCNICVEKYNKSTHLEIKCNYCDFSNCRTCFQKYLLDTVDPYCMNCKKIFTKEFISENCTQVFIGKEYKKHRENVLLDREKSLMPATQVYVILEKQKDKLREQIKEIEKERAKILTTINIFNNRINSLTYQITNININNMNNVNNQNQVVQTSQDKERKKFIRKCPMKDCRGFLSQQWKCGICETKICNKCNEEKLDTECDAEDNHRCDPGNVANMELLNKDTKPCPECGTMIFRISGCNQMFCVECHCAWNWNTGLVEKGVIHNPHYYDFIRRGGNTGRNHGDIPCGGLPQMYDLRTGFTYCLRSKIMTNVQESLLYSFHNIVTHIQHYEIRQINDQTEETTRTLRVDYMLQKISEETFKSRIQQIEKDHNKRRDFNNIYQMFVDVSSDIFRQIILCIETYKYKEENHDIINKCFTENITILLNLRKYFNENIKKIGTVYKCVYPGIDEQYYRFQPNYKTYLERERQRLREEANRQNVVLIN